MKIEESQESITKNVLKLCKDYFSKLHASYVGGYYDVPAEITLVKKSFWSENKLVILINRNGIDVNCKPLFDLGEWEDIKITIYDEKYMDALMKFAKTFENISNHSTTIIKSF